MKRSIILAALILSMAVPVFAEEELVWEEQAATEETYAFEEEDDVSVDEQTAIEEPSYVFEEAPEQVNRRLLTQMKRRRGKMQLGMNQPMKLEKMR